ncbi:MAG: zinc ribbon domain-containing protein [Thermoguttaceae bacterium]|nr:zinc ribbon domain-containing protein [Thermoguttaceae bacterium]
MPIYEYRCQKCNEEFELLVRRGTKLICPKCGDSRIKRQMSTTATPHSSSSASSDCVCPAHNAGVCDGGHVCGHGCCHHH